MGIRFFYKISKKPVDQKDLAYAQVLGVSINVDQQALRVAYLRKVKQFHPDYHPDSTLRMSLVNEAYAYLKSRLEKSS